MKVLHLPYNISSVASNSIKCLRSVGVEARGISYTNLVTNTSDNTIILEDYFFDNKIKRAYKQLEYTGIFFRMIQWADVLHYYWNADILPFNLEFKFIKWLNKPALVEFLGSEIRIPEVEYEDNIYYKRMMEKYNEKGDFSKLENSDRIQRKFSEQGFKTVTSPGMEKYLLPQYFPPPHRYLRQRIVIDEFTPAYPSLSNKVPLILHASTSPNIKGTEFIKAAIESLRHKYEFEFCYMEKMPRAEALGMMRKADIVVDQIIGGHHGFAAVEAMAFGKPVICYIKPTLIKDYPEELPIVNANPDTIYQVLEQLILDTQMRYDIGVRSRAYVEKYHHSKVLGNEMMQIYSELIKEKKL